MLINVKNPTIVELSMEKKFYKLGPYFASYPFLNQTNTENGSFKQT